MTADAAHVAALRPAMFDALLSRLHDDLRCGDGCVGCRVGAEALSDTAATVAVETLTTLIRAQVAAEIRARADEDGDWIGQTDPDSILRMAARIAEDGTP